MTSMETMMEKHSILSEFFSIMERMDYLRVRDRGVARDVLSTMIESLQRQLTLIEGHLNVSGVTSQETPSE